MALNPNFSVSITPGDPGTLIFSDDSTGSDVAVTQRRIFIQEDDGTYIVLSGTTTEYEAWADFPSTTTKTLTDILDKDYGCRVVVQWLDVSNVVKYDYTRRLGFTGYNEDFDYEKTQNVSSNQLLMNDNNFWQNKSLLRSLIDSGDKAIQRASDIATAQICYNLATEIRTNAQYYFNQSA